MSICVYIRGIHLMEQLNFLFEIGLLLGLSLIMNRFFFVFFN